MTAGNLASFSANTPAFEGLERFEGKLLHTGRWPHEAPDFTGARRRLTLFLAQYWGGPQTYMDERGHPRLRMRHMPFHIGPLERDRWLTHMAAAVDRVCDDIDDGDEIARELMEYFVPAAEHLRNDTGLPISSASYPSGPKRS